MLRARVLKDGKRLTPGYSKQVFCNPQRYLATTSARMAAADSKSSDWDAKRYLQFERERTRPARDLLAQVPLASPRRIVDLGCGPGNSTALLAERFPNAALAGMDSSPNMLDKARSALPGVDFHLGDLSTYEPADGVDLLFSNAAFHWVPAAERIPSIKRLLERLPSGGVFALQVPDNFTEPSHALMRATALEPGKPWSAVFGGRSPGLAAIPAPKELYDAFKPLCEQVDVWHTYYQHHLEGHGAIVDWVRTTGLRPYLEMLKGDEDMRKAFLHEYEAKLRENYKTLEAGGVLLRYPRLFVVMVKK